MKIEKLIKTTRFTRLYCNCDIDKCAAYCGHPVSVCQKHANYAVDGVQLCPDCLEYRQRMERLAKGGVL